MNRLYASNQIGRLFLCAFAAAAVLGIWLALGFQSVGASSRCDWQFAGVLEDSLEVDGGWMSRDCVLSRPSGYRLWADRYHFRIPEYTAVTVELSSNNRIAALILLTQSEDEIDHDSATQRGGTARITKTLEAGNYRLVATKDDLGVGAYSLTITSADPRITIVEALFPGYDASQINYDYNNHGDALEGYGSSCDGYQGGHAGWDVQTTSVAGNSTDNVPFHSLTAGRVIAVGGTFGKVAVYNANEDRTVLYAHARQIDVRVNQHVTVGTRLGIQGNLGLSSDPNKDEHVHVEIRTGERPSLACGADATIDPIDYLYKSVVGGG